MATKAQRRRLVEGLAYIHTHRKQWLQDVWRSVFHEEKNPQCGTFGCLAGHIAISLNASRPVVSVPPELWKKNHADRTDEEQALIDKANELETYVLATGQDDPRDIELQEVFGKSIRVVHVQSRAARLIGGLQEPKDEDEHTLFSSENKWPDMVRIAAKSLEISQQELREEISAVAQAKGWTKGKKADAR